MKKWILKLGIKSRHRLMIGIALLSIVIIGYVGYYFYETGKVLKIIINSERIHNVHYHHGLQHFYNYINTKDTNLLIDGFAMMDSANNLAYVFGNSEKSFREKSFDENVDLLYYSALDAFDYDRENAVLMSKRLKLLMAINNKYVKNSFKIAATGAEIGKNIKANMITYLKNPSPENLEFISKADKEMGVFFKNFARVIYDLDRFSERFLVTGILLSVLVLGALTIFLTTFISSTITRPILRMKENFEQLAIGNIDEDIEVESNDEIGQLGISANEMIANLVKITSQANIIATGDYSKNLMPRSEKDVLGRSIQKMTVSLREMSEEAELENWTKTGINQLNDEMRGDQDIHSLSRKVITFLSKYMKAEMGVIYLGDLETNEFKLTGSYAFSDRKSVNSVFRLGEGIVGQAALEREMISITDVPEDYFRITSGLGNAYPKNVVVAPVLFEDRVIGVIELAFFDELVKSKKEFLENVLENLGIALNTSYARTEMQKLLIKTQEQAEELMTQQEELRQSNEELEEQTKALRESEQQMQQQQEELRVTNEELEERTKAIEKQRDDIKIKNEELEKARIEIENKARDLEVASKYKSEFLANMSHELRTPLNSILVLSQILSKNKPGNLDEKQIKSAQTIYSSGNSLLSLINEVLDLSKVESGNLELDYEEMEIKSFTTEVEEIFNPLASDKGLEFHIHVSDGVPKSIETDRLRLQQIIRNLLSNAIKFTSTGSVKLEISVPSKSTAYHKKDFEHKDLIAFKVIDTGIGIPKAKQDLIFEAFKQADGTTTRKYGGTGLGLTISRNFTEVLGGEIHVESEENEGTTFTLYIPVRRYVDSKDSKPKPTSEKADAPANENREEEVLPLNSNGHQVKDDRKNIVKGDKFILIIEDDKDFSQVLYDLAHEKGFKCMIAPNGETGLHYADYYKPDAIILDIGLPGIDGWEVMDRLKENPETRHIPVHFMSGKDKSLEALKKGAIGFLKKPVSLDEIDNAFENIENIISKPLKKVLVVEDDKVMRSSIEELIEAKDVVTTSVPNGKEALELLEKDTFDCMILDLGLKDMSGEDLLKKIGKNGKFSQMPVIIYTGKDLGREEQENLQKYSDRIIIKGARSPERLFAETTLFLHKVESELPSEKQKMLKVVHNKEDVMKDKKVLIVDDDMRNVFALTSLLEERGMKVDVGRNGKEGVEKVESGKSYDLVLMDIMMPEMNGYEAMEIIRKNPKLKKLPIIALTAKAMQGDREKCIKAGANDYLTKPVDSDKLISLLKVWLYQ